MTEAIKLGEQIELYGFWEVDRSSMTILKKLIGDTARTMAERYAGFQKLTIKLDRANSLTVTVEVITAESTKTATAEGMNLFFTLDKAFKQL